MPSRPLRAAVLLALLAALAPHAAVAQQAATVAPLDRVYEDVETLARFGLVRRVVLGQRPWSRAEIARIVDEATRAVARADADAAPRIAPARLAWARRVLGRLAREHADGRERPRGTLRADVTGLASPPRLAPSNGSNTIDAAVNPLVDHRLGRRVVDGLTAAAEVDLHVPLGRRAALVATPRAQAAAGTDLRSRAGDVHELSVQRLALSAVAANVRLTVGRDHETWGTGERGGLVLSTNAPALDLVRVTNDTLFTLPSFLRHLGPIRSSAFVAALGRRATTPGAWLAGYRLAGRPFTPYLELGGSLVNQFGGRGAPTTTTLRRLSDLLMIDALLGTEGCECSQKLAGIDFRLRAPEGAGALAGAELYGAMNMDDNTIAHVLDSMREDGGYLLGVVVPGTAAGGATAVSVEARRTGIRFYQHAQYTRGLTLRRFVLGDALGSNADGAYLRATWDDGARHALSLDAAAERRRADQFVIGGDPIQFIKVESRPREWRWRAVGGWTWRRAPGTDVVTRAGWERVRNFDFVDGADRSNLLGEIGVAVRF